MLSKNIKDKGRIEVIPCYLEFFPLEEDFFTLLNCEISPANCIFSKKDLKNINKASFYCTICKKYVYKVQTISEYKELSRKNKCIYISQKTFNKIYCDLDQISCKKIEDSFKIYRLFLVYIYLKSEGYYSLKLIPMYDGSLHKQFRSILLAIIMDKNWKENLVKFISLGVVFDYIFSEIVPELGDSVLTNLINGLFKKYLNEIKIEELL